MQTNVLEYLEQSVSKFGDKLAFANESEGFSFADVYNHARAIGSFIANKNIYNQPVVVFMKKHPKTINAFFGVNYSGNYYVPLDEEMPRHRIELIFETLTPGLIICDEDTLKIAEGFNCKSEIFIYDDIVKSEINDDLLQNIRDKQIDTDPIYIVFTSGSTGVPKGVMACHRSVIDYIEHFCQVLKFDGDTVFGNQTPLYFDACLKEIYPTLKYGGTMYIIPKQFFMFPIKLVEFLNEKKINTVCWVVSALTMISSFRTFESIKPEYLRTIAFASEVFPIKQFNIWKEAVPNARYINLYGPTEATGICCYYEVDRDFGLDEVMPVGRPFKNTDIILLDENDQVPPRGEQGEICVRGTCLTLGYYKNKEKTDEAFVQNPLNKLYPELIYRTGDIGKYNARNELVFVSRKDYQIKHMGHRIELGEIEVIVNMHPDVASACCIFDNENKKIVLYYVGGVSKKDITVYIKEKLPRYMIPHVINELEEMPFTPNGKINRALLKEQYLNNK